jgi:hypothetical protein
MRVQEIKFSDAQSILRNKLFYLPKKKKTKIDPSSAIAPVTLTPAIAALFLFPHRRHVL